MAVKVGFIGTGGISRPHRKHLKNMDDVEVVAMCDLEEDRVAESRRRMECSDLYRLQNHARKRRKWTRYTCASRPLHTKTRKS